jgi:hypothetical protein
MVLSISYLQLFAFLKLYAEHVSKPATEFLWRLFESSYHCCCGLIIQVPEDTAESDISSICFNCSKFFDLIPVSLRVESVKCCDAFSLRMILFFERMADCSLQF